MFDKLTDVAVKVVEQRGLFDRLYTEQTLPEEIPTVEDTYVLKQIPGTPAHAATIADVMALIRKHIPEIKRVRTAHHLLRFPNFVDELGQRECSLAQLSTAFTIVKETVKNDTV